MSLFTTRDLWSTRCGGGEGGGGDCDDSFDHSSLVVANLSGTAEYLVAGSHSGLLQVYQPSCAKEEGAFVGYRPQDLLIETQLPHPVLQVAVGRLVSGTQNLQIGVLHPRSVAVYSLVTRTGATEHGNQQQLVPAYEHQLGRSAYSLVVGPFGGARNRDFLCVQSLDGALSFFEQESFSFVAFLPNFLIPAPVVFLRHADAFVTVASDWNVLCYRYQSVADSGSARDRDAPGGRRLAAEWTFNLGEPALDVQTVEWSSHTEVLVLGDRSLHCLRDDGTLRFAKRLDYAASCFHPYVTDLTGKLMTLVASESNTLLVYEGTTLRWSSQLDLSPVVVRRINLQTLNGVLALLSDEGFLQCCYLGTEPSLFMPPPLEVTEVDYREAGRELAELHKVINSYSKENTDQLADGAADRELEVTVACSSDLEPCAFPTRLACPVPSCRVTVTLRPHVPLAKVQVSVVVRPPLRASRATHSVSSLCDRYQVTSYVYLAEEGDVCSLEARVVTSYATGSRGVPRVLHNFAQLPLTLVYKVCPPVKDAAFKVTLNTNRPTVSLEELFPEFSLDDDSGNSAGFSLCHSDTPAVTVLTAKTSQRYRLQSGRFPALCLMAEKLADRLRRRFRKEEGFSCSFASALPAKELLEAIDRHFLCRRESLLLQDELAQRSSQFRLIQRRLLTKLKNRTPAPVASLDALLQDTHGKILASLERLEESEAAEAVAGVELSCAVRLTHLLLGLSGAAGAEDLAAALHHAVNSSEEQGWEEVTDVALSFLLRTSLARSVRDRQRSTPLSLAPLRDTARLKKHVASSLDRVRKGGGGGQQPVDGKENVNVNVGVSPIPESALEEEHQASEEEEEGDPGGTVPAGSRLAESSSARTTRGRPALLRARRRESPSPVPREGREEEETPKLEEHEEDKKPVVQSLQATEEEEDDDPW